MSRRPTQTERRRALNARRIGALSILENRNLVSESLGILTAGIGVPAALIGSPTGEAAGQSVQPRRTPTVDVKVAWQPVVTPRPQALGGGGSHPSNSNVFTTTALDTATVLGSVEEVTSLGSVPLPNTITMAQPSSLPKGGGGAGGTSHGGSGSVVAASNASPAAAASPDASTANSGLQLPASINTTTTDAATTSTAASVAAPNHSISTTLTTSLNTSSPSPVSTVGKGSVTPTPVLPVSFVSTPTPIASGVSTAPATPTPITTIVPGVSSSLSVGGYLDQSIKPGNLAGTGVTYLITQQPLPANMTFDRGTGELTFSPAPGEAGTYQFTVTAENGSGSIAETVQIQVTQPVLATTEVSGQVVDESGNPLPNTPVSIDGSTTTTDAHGDFTLKGVSAVPGPLNAGGALATAEDRQGLVAPLSQLLGHAAYADADNVLPQPLILPKIDWSNTATFINSGPAQPLDVSNPAMPGFSILTAAGAEANAPSSGTIRVAQLPASVSAQHMPQGVGGGLLLYQATGIDLSKPVTLTFPNTGDLKAGTTVSLLALNMTTGGHDVVGEMVVSADGKTMTTTTPVVIGHAQAPAAASVTNSPASTAGSNSGGRTYSPFDAPVGSGSISGSGIGGGSTSGSSSGSGSGSIVGSSTSGSVSSGGNTWNGCLLVEPSGGPGLPIEQCDGCEMTDDEMVTPGDGGGDWGNGDVEPEMDSDAGSVTGDYYLDHETVPYQSQGQSQNIDLQYNSGQANPNPVAQYQFTTPIDGDSSSITSVTAQVSLAGVVQGAATTYNTPEGLSDGTTYNIPLQVDGSSLATGAYPYTMTVTEYFGSGSGATSVTSNYGGYVNVVNASSDALGAGWSIGGLQQVSQATSGGPVVVTAGQQGTERFDPVYSSGGDYQDLAASAATTGASVVANDGTGSFSSGTDSVAGSTTLATATGDFNGDGKPDLAVLGQTALTVFLNNGSGGFGSGSTINLPTGYVGKEVAVGNFSGHTTSVLDIAVLMASTSTGGYAVAEYTGSGTGTFSGAVVSTAGNGDYTGSSTPNTIAVADFNDDGLSDLAFTTDNGLADVMLASGGGSFGSATSLSLPSGDLAIGIAETDYNGDGKPDLVVQVNDTNISESSESYSTLVALVLYTGSGTGSFTETSSYLTVGHPDVDTLGIVVGDFNGPSLGLEVAVPVLGDDDFVDIVPLASAGTWGDGVLYDTDSYYNFSPTQPGNIVAADLNGSGKPSIALTDSTNTVKLFLSDPDSNAILPLKTISYSSGSGGGSYTSDVGLLAVAPFDGHVASAGYRGPTSDPSTLVQNSNGTWTRSYPDDTVLQFNSSGQETSQTDRNDNVMSFAYVPTGNPGAGSLQTMTDPVGLITTLAYDSSGHLHTVTDPADRVTTITINSSDNLTDIEDPDGAIEQYGYSTPSNHEVTTETDPNDNTATAHYNSFGQLTSETLFGGTATTTNAPAQANGLLAPGGSGSLSSVYEGSVTDPDGRTTTVTYSWMSHPTSVTDSTGARSSTVFNSRGFPVAETDALGRTTTYTFDSNRNVTSITQPSSGSAGGYGYGSPSTETIVYNDPYGIPTSITDFNGNTTTFTLDSHGNVLEETYPDGVSEQWTYNSAGQVLTDTTRGGHTTTYAYDAEGNLTTITYPGAGSPQIVMRYDAAGDMTSMTDELGNTTTCTYDLAGRVLSEENPIQAAAGHAATFAYDADGNLISETDPLGNVTTYAYDARDQVIGMTDAANQGTSHQTAYSYDADGNLISITDPLGHETTFAYDNDNREIGMTDPDGNHTTYTYDLDGERTSTTDPNGNTTEYTYNNRGQMSSMILPATADPTGGSSGGGYTYNYNSSATYLYAYDADGNKISETDPNGGTTTYTYNSVNQQVAVADPLDHTTTTSYDADGQVATVTDPLNHITSFVYNARDQLISETQPSGGGTTTYTYNLDDELTTVTDPDDNVTTYTYNAAAEKANQTSPTGGVTTYTYDLDGNLTQTVDPLGRIIQYGYDADNRETTEKWIPVGGGTAFYTMTITYDTDGRETEVQDNYSEYTYGYNSDNEVTSISDAGTPGLPHVTLTYSYDGDGNRTSETDSLGGIVSYTYDARDQLVSESQSGTGGSGVDAELALFDYDQDGNLTDLTRYSNLSASSEVAKTVDAYDTADRLTTTTNETSTGSTISSYVYTLDVADRLTTEARTWTLSGSTYSDTATYVYINNNQLTSVTHTDSSFASESFSYDSNGNQNSTGDSTGTGNELTSNGTYDYTYDADGNMIGKTAIATGVELEYTYDYRNRLIEVQQVSGGATTTLAQYTYDALNRQIEVVEGGATRYSLYDGQTPLLDFNGSGTMTARYLSVPGAIDEVLARQTSAGVAWYLTDREGSVNDLISNSGTVIDHVDYSAYGIVLDESSPSAGDRFKYAGMELDATTGLYYDRARYYDATMGRFVGEDPLGFAGGDDNEYRYTGNDPSNFLDPSGRLSLPTGDIGPMNGPGLWDSFVNWLYTGDPNPDPEILQAALEAAGGSEAENSPYAHGALQIIGRVPCVGKIAILTDLALTDIEQNGELSPQTLLSILWYILNGGECFAAGTPILTPDGDRPIETLKVGDYVLSCSEHDANGPVRPRRIEAVFEKESAVLSLSIGDQIIRSSPKHPFWVEGKGWVFACDLTPGDKFRCHDGNFVSLESIREERGTSKVYNLRVSVDHTYFVGSSEWGFSVWSHNDSVCTYHGTSESGAQNILDNGVQPVGAEDGNFFLTTTPGSALNWGGVVVDPIGGDTDVIGQSACVVKFETPSEIFQSLLDKGLLQQRTVQGQLIYVLTPAGMDLFNSTTTISPFPHPE